MHNSTNSQRERVFRLRGCPEDDTIFRVIDFVCPSGYTPMTVRCWRIGRFYYFFSEICRCSRSICLIPLVGVGKSSGMVPPSSLIV